MFKRNWVKAIGILFVMMVLLSTIGGAVPLRAAGADTPVNKVSSMLSMHIKIKEAQTGINPQVSVSALGNDSPAGADTTSISSERVFLHFAQKPSTTQLKELNGLGVTVYPNSWIPPVGSFKTGFVLADMPVNKLDALTSKSYIISMDTAEETLTAQNDQARAAMNVGPVWQSGDTGAGVTVAVLDSGIDTTNPDFPSLNSRNSKDYSNYPDLDDTITNTVTGHGTHVTGSLLGRGINSSIYKGVAPGASLIFLKVGNDTNGNASDAAIAYAIEAAVDIYHAKIINLSYGGWSDYHDGSDPLCQAVDYATSLGTTVFVAAGNDGANGWHYSGTVAPNSTTADIYITSSTGSYLSTGLVWFDGIGTHNELKLLYYDDSQTLLTPRSSGQSESSRGTECNYYEFSTPQPFGGYILRVQNTSSTPQQFHLYYMGGSTAVSFSSGGDPNYTITSPAEADGAIAVGAYVTRTSWTNYKGNTYSYSQPSPLDSIASFSSTGPRVDAGAPPKPEIVAPGSAIISVRDSLYSLGSANDPAIIDDDGFGLGGSNPGPANYYIMQGTSMASPIAAGVGALLLSAKPSLTPAQVKSAMETTAVDKGSVGFDIIYGYGLVDAAAALVSLKPRATTINITTAPVAGTTVDDILSKQPVITVLDQYGNPLSGVIVTASRGTGTGILRGKLTATSQDVTGLAAFTDLGYSKSGESFTIHFTVGVLTANSTPLDPLSPGTATQISEETLADGSGSVVAGRLLSTSHSITVFGVTRDQFDNYVGNPNNTIWSLQNKSGGITDTDLSSVSGAQTTFTGNAEGSVVIHVSNGTLTPGDSGIINVVHFSGIIAFETATIYGFTLDIANADGSGKTRLGGYSTTMTDMTPALSPTGDRIAYQNGGNICVITTDGSKNIILTNGTYPAWSPDGFKIAFVRGRQIWIMNADGSNQNAIVTQDNCQSPSWSPDGTKIVYSAYDFINQLFIVNIDGSNKTKLTNDMAGGGWAPSWSPDGTKIAYNSQFSNIYVIDPDGSYNTQLTSDSHSVNPAWSPDGTKIIFQTYEMGYNEIWIMNENGSDQLPCIQGDNDWSPSWSRYVVSATVTNSLGAKNITNNSATLTGKIEDNGGENPVVYICWGTTDGGTNGPNWAHAINLAVVSTEEFHADIAWLTPGTTYYYRCFAENSVGSSWASSTATFTTLPAGTHTAQPTSDYDGDGKSDLSIYRPFNGVWWVIDSSTGVGVGQWWGETGDVPVPGDYDGDGKTDLAIYRPSNGVWWVIDSSTGVGVGQWWGETGDVPVPGDYDGDGKTDLAIYRPSNGVWWVIDSSTGVGVGQWWGETGDIPVPGDYDGDGKTDLAIYRPSNGVWWVIDSSTGVGVGQWWGETGDIPVPGDYDGDGKTDLAIYRPSNGVWWVINSSTGAGVGQWWGETGDIPVPGDYDGDGETDLAIYRPSNGVWWVNDSSTNFGVGQWWGETGDIPLPGVNK